MQEFKPTMLDLSAGHATEDFVTDDLPLKEVIIQGVPESELITQAQEGPDQEAYAAIFRQHEPRVANAVRWTPHQEDVVQDAYVRGWQGLGSFKNQGKGMSPWLTRIAYNRAIELWRRDNRITMRATDPHDPHSALQTTPDNENSIDRAIAKVARTMDPEAAQRVLATIEGEVGLDAARLLQIIGIEGRRLKDYAEIAGVAAMTANTRIRRIRQKLGQGPTRAVIFEALEAEGIL